MISLYRETKDKKYLKLAKGFAAKIKGYALAGVRRLWSQRTVIAIFRT